jgi:hypothetical protein
LADDSDPPDQVADAKEWSVELDIQITRRRRAHSIINPAGEAVYHASGIGQVIRWLNDQGVPTALFIEPEGVYRVRFTVLADHGHL